MGRVSRGQPLGTEHNDLRIELYECDLVYRSHVTKLSATIR